MYLIKDNLVPGAHLHNVHIHVCYGCNKSFSAFMCKFASDYSIIWMKSCGLYFSGLLDSRWGSQDKEPHKDYEGGPSDPCRSPNPADWYPHTEQPQGTPILTCTL